MVYLALSLSAVLVIVDQIIKFIASKNLIPGTTTSLINIGGKDWLNLTYVENTGAGFSLLQGFRWLLVTVTAAFIIAAVVFLILKKPKNQWYLWSLSVIIGGGLGNLLDRIFRGYVIDYIDVRIINFAVFNFADCCVVIGAIILLIATLFFSKENKDDKI